MNFSDWLIITEATTESDLANAVNKVKAYLDEKSSAEIDMGMKELMELKNKDVVPNSELNAAKEKFKVHPDFATNIYRAVTVHNLVPLPLQSGGGYRGLDNQNNPEVDGKPNPFYKALGTDKFENWNKYKDAFIQFLWAQGVSPNSEKIAKNLKKYAKYANDFPFMKPIEGEKAENYPNTEALMNVQLKSGKVVSIADWMEDAGNLWKTLSDFIKENIQSKAKKDADIKREKKEEAQKEKVKAKEVAAEKVRAETPVISFKAVEELGKEIDVLLSNQKDEYKKNFLIVANEQIDKFIASSPKPRDYSEPAIKMKRDLRARYPLGAQLVVTKDDAFTRPPEDKLEKVAEQSWRNVSQIFFSRITGKLAPIVAKKAATTGKQANIKLIYSSANYGSLEARLKIQFADGSSFSVVHKMVAAISGARRGAMFSSGGGKRFYRFPTTFHNVILPNGESLKHPSAMSVYLAFAGLDKPPEIEKDEETEVNDLG